MTKRRVAATFLHRLAAKLVLPESPPPGVLWILQKASLADNVSLNYHGKKHLYTGKPP